MKVKIFKIEFSDVETYPSNIPGIRGYFLKQFPNDTELHNHLPGGKYSYRFPIIQYRVINKHPALIGIDEGVEILKKIFFATDKLRIRDKVVKSYEKTISCSEYEFGATDEKIDYEFVSPWLALKEENFEKYKTLSSISEKHEFLNSILKYNMLTISKGFKYTIPNLDDIKVEGHYLSKPVKVKDIEMLGFLGSFTINFHIPDYLGIGKQSSRGFGVVRKI